MFFSFYLPKVLSHGSWKQCTIFNVLIHRLHLMASSTKMTLQYKPYLTDRGSVLYQWGNTDLPGHKGKVVMYYQLSMPVKKQKLSLEKGALASALRRVLSSRAVVTLCYDFFK